MEAESRVWNNGASVEDLTWRGDGERNLRRGTTRPGPTRCWPRNCWQSPGRRCSCGSGWVLVWSGWRIAAPTRAARSTGPWGGNISGCHPRASARSRQSWTAEFWASASVRGSARREKSYFRCETRQKDLHVSTYLKNVRDILGNVDDEEHLRSLSITEVVINIQQRQRRPQLLHVYHQRRHRRWSQGINRQIAAKLFSCHPDGARIELLT